MIKYTNIPKDVLYNLYINEKLSTNAVAEKLHLSNLTIRKALKHFDITIRGCGPTNGIKFTPEHRANISKASKGTKNGINPMTGKSYRWDKRKVKCAQCKKILLVAPYKLNQDHVFCNKKCFFKFRSIHWTGEDHPKYTRQIVICDQCKKQVALPLNRLSHSKKHFCDKKCHNEWYRTNRQTPEEYKRKRELTNAKIVSEALEHYGNKCVCCGENNKLFLVFDHVRGGGAKFRHKTGMTGRVRMSYWLKKNKWPSDIQILCSNCNAAKGDKQTCPCKNNKTKQYNA